MATANIQSFLEDRLRALDPTIDLEAGSPAQIEFIEPVLTYLGTDPFETDIDGFISDRFAQEFPDIFAGDPGAVRDTFIKPLILLLEPFKREIQTIKRNQSIQDPTVLSDEDADAIVANVFDERDPGAFAVGVGRIVFPNPTNIQIEITNRFYTSSGLGFFPTNPVSITAEEMAFNKVGTQYFFDVPVKAESEGGQYNIDVDNLSGIDGVFGYVRVTNLSKFANGSARVDTPTFVASAREALNERSLVTRRGATARLMDVFQTDLRAVQVIGAKDPEMQRDILVALSPGHQWITGLVSLWKNMALVQARTIEGDETDAPVPGDTLYFYLSAATHPGLAQGSRLVRVTVDAVYVGPLAVSAPYQMMYLVQWSGALPTGVSVANGASFEGGFSKKGNVAIRSMPGVGETNFEAPNGEIHVLGHTDFYVRPILQPTSQTVFEGLSDYLPVIERLTLQTLGLSAQKNRVDDTGINFQAMGVERGDLLSIETGDDIGIYTIIQIGTTTLLVNADLTNSQNNLRYRVIKRISVDPFEPKIKKFPFGSILANDLQTTIGSTLFQLLSNDVLGFGAAIGDVIRVTDGLVAGDYTITGFDPVLGGQGLIVDRPATASLSSLPYEVYTELSPVERPLVRIKEMTLLDSSQQATGIDIPLADPVGVVPTSSFTSARVRGSSQRLSGFVLPSFRTTAFTTYLSGGPVAAPSGDRRYSLGFDTPNGWYFPVQFADGTYAELDYRANPTGFGSGDQINPASYFVAISEEQDDAENFPPIDPKAGECLSIRNGPNKGDYVIKSVSKFKHKLTGPSRTVWTYFIQIHGKFPVDVLGQLFDFLNDVGGGAAVTQLPVNGSVTFPTFYINLYNSLGAKLNSALTTLGVASPPSSATLQTAVDSLVFASYDWGDPARGVLRTFFQSPTLFSQKTGAAPTLYSFKTPSGEVLKFRPDVNRYQSQQIVPPRLDADADPLSYPRDIDVVKELTYTLRTNLFDLGDRITGSTSGAVGYVTDFSEMGTSGDLTLRDVVGAFITGETITSDAGVPATATAGTTTTINRATLNDESTPSPFLAGVEDGDVLSVHEEIFFHGTDNSRQTAVQTISGSTQVTAPASSGPIFEAAHVGNLLFIEQGVDRGAYRIIKYIDSQNVLLDQAMTESTPTIIAQGSVDDWGYDGSNNFIESTGFDFSPHIGKMITIFGVSYNQQGSYVIAAAPMSGIAQVTKSPNFIGTSHTETDAVFVITNPSPTPPAMVLNGTTLVAVRPIRMYEASAKEITILGRDASTTARSIYLVASPSIVAGLNQPYRIFRRGLRRITPTEMADRPFGPLVYFDTEVTSFSPHISANIDRLSFLTVDEGTFGSLGYRHKVEDRTLTYSMQEEGFLEISTQILPIGSSDSPENYLNLLGASVQVTYEQSDLVRRVQEFADSAQDRVTSANMLVRHFLPAYVSYDATYVGGSAPSVIAEDIVNYVDNLPVETPLDVSEVQDLIARRGGNLTTPTAVQTLVHDWSRKVWLEFSENELGGLLTKVPYDGTPRVSFFIPGPDVSGQDPLPSGERINLTRQ